MMMAGIVILAGGVMFAVRQEHLGTHPLGKGAVIAVAGLILLIHGWIRSLRE